MSHTQEHWEAEHNEGNPLDDMFVNSDPEVVGAELDAVGDDELAVPLRDPGPADTRLPEGLTGGGSIFDFYVTGKLDVVPTDLGHFATMIGADTEAYDDSKKTSIVAHFQECPMPSFVGNTGPTGVPFGEGLALQSKYLRSELAMGMLLDHVSLGMALLGQAATLIHLAYSGSDFLDTAGTQDYFADYGQDRVLQAFTQPEVMSVSNLGDLDAEDTEALAESEFDQLVEDMRDNQRNDDAIADYAGSGDHVSRDDQVLDEGELSETTVPQDQNDVRHHDQAEDIRISRDGSLYQPSGDVVLGYAEEDSRFGR